MTFYDWIAAVPGRLTRVATHFGITKSAVSQWCANGVPVDRMAAVHEFTGGAVAIEEMVRHRTLRREAA